MDGLDLLAKEVVDGVVVGVDEEILCCFQRGYYWLTRSGVGGCDFGSRSEKDLVFLRNCLEVFGSQIKCVAALHELKSEGYEDLDLRKSMKEELKCVVSNSKALIGSVLYVVSCASETYEFKGFLCESMEETIEALVADLERQLRVVLGIV